MVLQSCVTQESCGSLRSFWKDTLRAIAPFWNVARCYLPSASLSFFLVLLPLAIILIEPKIVTTFRLRDLCCEVSRHQVILQRNVSIAEPRILQFFGSNRLRVPKLRFYALPPALQCHAVVDARRSVPLLHPTRLVPEAMRSPHPSRLASAYALWPTILTSSTMSRRQLP